MYRRRTSAIFTNVTGHALIIANPAAAHVNVAMVDAVAEQLARHVEAVAVAWTAGAGDATTLARRAAAGCTAELIVALGGDGTVREVAQGLSARSNEPDGSRSSSADPLVLVLPAGSGNSTARNLWGESEWPDILAAAFDRRRSAIRTIDLLHLLEADRVAVLGASSGFLAAVLVAAQQRSDLPRGLDRYRAAAATVLAAMPDDPTEVRVDGELVFAGRASLVAVGGGRYRARSLMFLPHSILDDGLLDVCVLSHLEGQALAEVASDALTGDHVGRPEVTYARGRQVTVERTDGLPLGAEYDGDLWADAGPGVTMAVVPGGLRVLAASDAPGG